MQLHYIYFFLPRKHSFDNIFVLYILFRVINKQNIKLYCSPTFLKIVKLKSVQSFKPDTYLATLMNCSMWLFYGLPIVHPHSLLVVTINSAGILITITFCSIFFIYSSWTCRVRILFYSLTFCRAGIWCRY
ncbi:putative SWEET sugar transporter [Helianthus annuus]|nr:putative SWEET sugar transporter [Helianthus annuus]